ncbi:MAG: hypothetical protein ABFE13_18245 [Phycisphaerales bacterium]
MQTIGHIAHRAHRLFTAAVMAVLAGVCPQHPAWGRYGVRIGR